MKSVVIIMFLSLIAFSNSYSFSGAFAAETTSQTGEVEGNKSENPDDLSVTKIYTEPANYKLLGSTIVKLIVTAFLLEMALSVLFNWRFWIVYAEDRGIKTLVNLAVAAVVVLKFDLNVFGQILQATTGDAKYATEPFGDLVSTFILAGGSATAFKVAEFFGVRTPVQNKARAASARDIPRYSLSFVPTPAGFLLDADKGIKVFLDGNAVNWTQNPTSNFFKRMRGVTEAGEHILQISGFDTKGAAIELDEVSFVAVNGKIAELLVHY